jgi:uncharacterized protein
MPAHQPYLEAWRHRWRQEAVARERHAERARAVADGLALMLRERFDARRVILIGSLARGEFRVGSDIDLVVEGIAPGRLFRAGADAERAAGGFDVDLLPMESAPAAVLDGIAREGIELS